jgi:hypothetical protein
MKDIIDLLVLREYYGVSKRIDTAKGMYKLPYNFTELKKLWKRIWKSKK